MDSQRTSHQGQFLGKANGYDVIDCGQCGFRHLNPIPTLEDLDRIYPREYYSSEYPDWIAKTLQESEYWNLVYDDRYDVFEHFVSAEHRRMLDVGSFLGLFLLTGKRRGWTVLGIEPSEQGLRYAHEREIETLKGYYEQFENKRLGHFGAVNLTLTMEHVIDPIGILRKTFAILAPGGIVCVEVPNDFSPMQDAVRKALNKSLYWLAAPHHINYFDFDSLTRVLEKTGYRVVHRTTTFPMEFFLMMGDDYLGNDPFGRQCHSKRMNFEMNMDKGGLRSLRLELYKFLASKGVGREVVLFAQKPAV